MEYISFLKLFPSVHPQEESHRMIVIRKVYQRVINNPTHQFEQLWKDYEKFENSVSRQLAKGLVSEYQPKYNIAREVYQEWKKYFDEIGWDMLAVPPTGSSTNIVNANISTSLNARESSTLISLTYAPSMVINAKPTWI
ncbi:hypothetical protein RYX36_014547 [Vicia faba]